MCVRGKLKTQILFCEVIDPKGWIGERDRERETDQSRERVVAAPIVFLH